MWHRRFLWIRRTKGYDGTSFPVSDWVCCPRAWIGVYHGIFTNHSLDLFQLLQKVLSMSSCLTARLAACNLCSAPTWTLYHSSSILSTFVSPLSMDSMMHGVFYCLRQFAWNICVYFIVVLSPVCTDWRASLLLKSQEILYIYRSFCFWLCIWRQWFGILTDKCMKRIRLVGGRLSRG
jgi:hypothetical protein